MNTAHLAHYANLVLETLGMETQGKAFWEGLWHGVGDSSVIPQWYIDGHLKQVKRQLVRGMHKEFEAAKDEIQEELDDDWQQIKDIVTEAKKPVELPDGDIILFCRHCEKRTQHTQTITRRGGYPLYECVICDGGRI